MPIIKSNVVLVDDHVLLRNGLATLVDSFDEYSVLFEADHGRDFIEKLKPGSLPDIVLLDINMPEMDGYETALWIKKNQPDIKVLALSMYDTENSIIRMLKNGARGYLLKDIDPSEFKHALDSLARKGFYYSETVTGKLIHAVNNLDGTEQISGSVGALSEKEIEFMKWVCTELTYKEIAEKMSLSPRTIDGYRDSLFQRLNIKTRVGLVLYAIRNGIVNI